MLVQWNSQVIISYYHSLSLLGTSHSKAAQCTRALKFVQKLISHYWRSDWFWLKGSWIHLNCSISNKNMYTPSPRVTRTLVPEKTRVMRNPRNTGNRCIVYVLSIPTVLIYYKNNAMFSTDESNLEQGISTYLRLHIFEFIWIRNKILSVVQSYKYDEIPAFYTHFN